ncbi:hypothetical protein [Massilia sp. CF038]|uniref:hypothetical protein n=1 Tax=Massilia sp. CF038 TaxID=1881045 RepID=UPI00092495AC|nr:hypothetical protein [Massilia sp. CF038]SHG37459.1 hypothetical protein SAMN05428948_0141 [Massilia sp. CF038]
MSAAYQHLALSEVKPGMVLSDELLDQQGQVLLPKGAVLTARTIALLPGHGIDSLAVLRADALDTPAAPLDAAAIEARLAHLFRRHDPSLEHDWATALLRRYITDFRLERGNGA